MSTLNKKDVKSILKALNEGRQIYKTSKKTPDGSFYWESLNPDTRKLMGLTPLSELGFVEAPREALGGTK
jgi:hypothetical protein|tara:strand:- start:45 stop:254 length:210 start_codon:yes stop_codon:yes gene_type:complete